MAPFRARSSCRTSIKPEDIKASMAKGVLTVTLPKPAQAASKRIEVKAAA